jgi:hypothetical protein
MKNKYIILVYIFTIFLFQLQASELVITENCPDWMLKQIHGDLDFFKNKRLCLREADRFFNMHRSDLLLVKFTISNNKISYQHSLNSDHAVYRMNCYLDALTLLSQKTKLPDTCFFISMHDDLTDYNIYKFPIFTQAKLKNNNRLILVPDFEALKAKYQVLPGMDITKEDFLWHTKTEQLIWRGSSAQKGFDNSYVVQSNNFHNFSRITLCQLSLQFPMLIDAKFTQLSQVENPSLLERYKGEFMSFEEQSRYKYHILIDGNTCAFSNSCWKFFINSLIFKPDSARIQWYYNELIPGVHFLPVKANLEDLVDQITWAIENDTSAQLIAKNGRDFAISHLCIEQSLIYLYFVILEYSKLNFC